MSTGGSYLLIARWPPEGLENVIFATKKKTDYFRTVFGVCIIIITVQTFEPTESHHHRRQKGLTSYDL